MSWTSIIAERTDRIRGAGRWRQIRTLDSGTPATSITTTGSNVVSFAANDYLGLSQHPQVVAAARDELELRGSGAGAARLIVGGRPIHDQLEAALADWKGTEAAVLFPTGYQANLGILGSLAAAAPGCVMISDALNHASIIDGTRLSRAQVEVVKHRDIDAVRTALISADGRPCVVVTDSVFSMDGDRAPVEELIDLSREHDALLVLDEAHAVFDSTPPAGVSLDHVVRVGTLSKTLGSVGGFVAATRSIVDLCVNTSRTFIFTTAGAPADAAAALAAVSIVRSDEGRALIRRLEEFVERVTPGHPSPIIPVLVGDEHRAMDLSTDLLQRGILVPAIRPPTVAPGTCRLRIALSAAHTFEQIDQLVEALSELGVEVGTNG